MLEQRGATITAAVGKDICTIPQRIRMIASWLSVAFIAIGVLSTMARYKRMVAIPDSEHFKPNFLYSKFKIEYFVLVLIGSAIWGLSVILPSVMTGYPLERTFFQMLPVLSLFFVVMGIMVARWLKARPHWIIFVSLYQGGWRFDGYIYLRPTDITVDRVVTEYPNLFAGKKKIYATNGSEIYR